MFLTTILLRKRHSSTYGDRRPDDPVTPEERRSEEMHRTASASRHPALAAKQFANDAFDGPPTQ
jgi:hypothetical protein